MLLFVKWIAHEIMTKISRSDSENRVGLGSFRMKSCGFKITNYILRDMRLMPQHFHLKKFFDQTVDKVNSIKIPFVHKFNDITVISLLKHKVHNKTI